MHYTADLHTHSHYAEGTSPSLNLESLYQWAIVKGINILGTGDLTHPLWIKELQEKLSPCDNGLFLLKNPPKETALPGLTPKYTDVHFCLSGEINCEYVSGGRRRRVHHLIYSPSFEVALQINKRLSVYGNLLEDGRPTIHLSSRNLLEILLEISPDAYLIPAHVWTPWFSMLGSDCGYNSVEECFQDLSDFIFALETGLSTDPAMNRRCSKLDRYTMISNSDAHSLTNLGREANLFQAPFSYYDMFDALKTSTGFAGTFEYFPEAGKYSYDGHRQCKISLSVAETRLYKNRCPSCGKALTIGAFNRVEQLADRTTATCINDSCKYIVPLLQLLAEIYNALPSGKRIQQGYIKVINVFGNEFDLLHSTPLADIQSYDRKLAKAIECMRNKMIDVTPGYDGVYGRFNFSIEDKSLLTQLSMF